MPTSADDTAVLAAGYKKVQTDFGASAVPRYQTCYAMPITGYAGGSGQPLPGARSLQRLSRRRGHGRRS